MYVILRDINGDQYTIRSENVETIKSWFAEYLPLMMQDSEKRHYHWQIEVWGDQKIGMNPIRYQMIGSAGYRELAIYFNKAADNLDGIVR